jgi:hypothetical protein
MLTPAFRIGIVDLSYRNDPPSSKGVIHNRKWKQQELVEATQCSIGLVSRMLNEYLRLGWVEGPRTHWELVKPNDLLDAWAAADDWKKRGALRQYSWLGQGAMSWRGVL